MSLFWIILNLYNSECLMNSAEHTVELWGGHFVDNIPDNLYPSHLKSALNSFTVMFLLRNWSRDLWESVNWKKHIIRTVMIILKYNLLKLKTLVWKTVIWEQARNREQEEMRKKCGCCYGNIIVESKVILCETVRWYRGREMLKPFHAILQFM